MGQAQVELELHVVNAGESGLAMVGASRFQAAEYFSGGQAP